MTTLAISFSNFGPYHLARLRGLAQALERGGGRLIAYETAGTERLYPWQRERGDEPFTWVTLFPDQPLETIPQAACVRAMAAALERDRPDGVAVAGYFRPESRAALRWANRSRRPAILMSESQAIDHRRVWWREAVKRQLVRRFSAALVGGPRHRDYLARLGMPRDRIILGYNAVDNARYAAQAAEARKTPAGREGLPERPYFLSVNRFVPEKNLARLIRAYAQYRAGVDPEQAWDLVLCGGGPGAGEVEEAVASSGVAGSIHRPGFLQADELARWYAFASAFVHPSLLEPWGLVVNEAAACGLPLLVSNRAGCSETLVPSPAGTTGRVFDPRDVNAMAGSLAWVAALPELDRQAMGNRARALVAQWGPERFGKGTIEALLAAHRAGRSRRKRRAECV